MSPLLPKVTRLARRGRAESLSAGSSDVASIDEEAAHGELRPGLLGVTLSVAPPRRRRVQASQRPANCAACGFDLCPASFMIGGHLGVGDEALPALLVPVEDDPDPIVLGGVAEDERALRSVLLALLGARASRRSPGSGRSPRPGSLRVACRSPFVVCRWCGVVGQAARSRGLDQALLRIDRAEALDDLEPAARAPGRCTCSCAGGAGRAPSPPARRGPRRSRAWSSAAITSAWPSEPASVTAAAQSRSPR